MMKRKVVSGVCVFAALVSLMTGTVLAASSVSNTQEITTSKDTVKSDSVITVGGQQMSISEAVEQKKVEITFKESTKNSFVDANVPDDVADDIINLNSAITDTTKTEEEKKTAIGLVLDQAVKSSSSEASEGIEISKLSMLTSIQELSFVDKTTGQVITDAKDVTLTWKAPLTNDMTVENVRVLHYSVAKGEWELIKPTAIDPVTGEITAFFTDLSPVAIVYVQEDVNGGSGSGSGDSAGSASSDSGTPSTGDSQNILFYAGALILAAACLAGLALSRSKKRA